MTDINTLINNFVNAKKYSRQERAATYELACLAADLYFENEKLKSRLFMTNTDGFIRAITEEDRLHG